jgi:hypothetical protein
MLPAPFGMSANDWSDPNTVPPANVAPAKVPEAARPVTVSVKNGPGPGATVAPLTCAWAPATRDERCRSQKRLDHLHGPPRRSVVKSRRLAPAASGSRIPSYDEESPAPRIPRAGAAGSAAAAL